MRRFGCSSKQVQNGLKSRRQAAVVNGFWILRLDMSFGMEHFYTINALRV